jgi:hypothetical protein
LSSALVGTYAINVEGTFQTRNYIFTYVTGQLSVRRILVYTVHSPVYLIVTDPSGLVISKDINQIPEATYTGWDTDGDGIISIPDPKPGSYQIALTQKDVVDQNAVYTLTTRYNGLTIPLADGVGVMNIPQLPYGVQVTPVTSTDKIVATPVMTWSDPSDIIYGTPLTSTQLDATASVAGSFVYQPEAGTILKAGSGQTLSVVFTPTDTALYTTTTGDVTINVHYSWSDYLPPINRNGKSTFKMGTVIPVMFQLKDANGNFVSIASAQIFLAPVVNNVPGKEIPATSSANSNVGNSFRYDNKGKWYIINLDTKPLSAGTWQLRTALDDGTSKLVKIQLK